MTDKKHMPSFFAALQRLDAWFDKTCFGQWLLNSRLTGWLMRFYIRISRKKSHLLCYIVMFCAGGVEAKFYPLSVLVTLPILLAPAVIIGWRKDN